MIGGLDDWMGRLLRGAIICGVVGMLVAIAIEDCSDSLIDI